MTTAPTAAATSAAAITAAPARPQTRGEEYANALSHGLGGIVAAALLPVLATVAARRGGAGEIVGVVLFAASMLLLYAVSTLYHALPAGRAKQWMQRLDHAAIFVFIAGSYMPYALGALRGAWGWSLFGVVWALAAVGVAAKLLQRLRHPLASTALYLAMGWVALAAVPALLDRLDAPALTWLVAGGLAYSAGALVFLFDDRLRFGHFAWHLFVLAGSGCHVAAALHALTS
jgi:hemolysin III